MIRSVLVALLLALPLAAQEPTSRPASAPTTSPEALPEPDDIFPGEPETVEMKRGDVKVFTYVPETDGEASIWGSSKFVDVTLEILNARGKRLVADDDSGGGTTAWCHGPTVANAPVTIVVRAKPIASGPEPAAGSVEIGVVEIPKLVNAISLAAEVTRLCDAMRPLIEAGNLAEARREGKRALALLDGLPEPPLPSKVEDAIDRLGLECYFAQDAAAAASAGRIVLGSREKRLPPDHPLLQGIRTTHARALRILGDVRGAKALEEVALEVFERTLPDDHPDLLTIRESHAGTLTALGDLEGAKALDERVLAVRERTLPPDHPDLARARENYASTLSNLDDYDGARRLQEQVLEAYEKTLPPHHQDLLRLRMNYANTLSIMGETSKARRLQESLLDVLGKMLPPNHPELLNLRMNHASNLAELGDVGRARDVFEEILRIREADLPEGHKNLQEARMNLAMILRQSGDVRRAKALQEKVLRIFEESGISEDHPDVLSVTLAYAESLGALGDLAGARALQERVLAARERLLSSDHPKVQSARLSYSQTLSNLGDYKGSMGIVRRVLAARARTLPPDHEDVRMARAAYAAALSHLDRHAEAIAVYEEIVPVDAPLSEDADRLQFARMGHAASLMSTGEVRKAQRLIARVHASLDRELPDDHPQLRMMRWNHAVCLHALSKFEKEDVARELDRHLERFVAETVEAAERLFGTLSSRQISAAVLNYRRPMQLALSLSVPGQAPELDHLAFRLAEELRCSATRARRLPRVGSRDAGKKSDEIRRLRGALAERTKEVEDLIARPSATPGVAGSAAIRLAKLVDGREKAERALVASLRKLPEAAELLRRIDAGEIAAALPQDAAAVSWIAYPRVHYDEESPVPLLREVHHVVAFVLNRAGTVTRVELGPRDEITRLVAWWRRLIGAAVDGEASAAGAAAEARARKVGASLRRAVLDPVLAAAGKDVKRLVVALTGELFLFGLDSLPLDQEEGCVGDRFAIDVVGGLQWIARRPHGELNPPALLALGDVDFQGAPEPLDLQREGFPLALRGGRGESGQPVWKQGFRPLPFTKAEALEVSDRFEDAFEESRPPTLLTGRRAAKERFCLEAPKARYLHLATHGWFAPDSVPSLLDSPPDERAIGIRATDFRSQVRGYEPLSLCGLSLTGANLEPRPDGSHPGLLHGNEILDLDLAGVELAVLSACDTSVGVRRAGQGLMSLQEALFTAGVRYSVTSLWKVPDEATMKLMTRFYEGIWRKGETKREALWNAKLGLRRAKDPRTGKRKYGLRDWAGWVLVGNPETKS